MALLKVRGQTTTPTSPSANQKSLVDLSHQSHWSETFPRSTEQLSFPRGSRHCATYELWVIRKYFCKVSELPRASSHNCWLYINLVETLHMTSHHTSSATNHKEKRMKFLQECSFQTQTCCYNRLKTSFSTRRILVNKPAIKPSKASLISTIAPASAVNI